ncbi:MAG TPA: glycoside-pentoside-hexuronide (GPH):cation symporter [Clostridia bacterium]|mgnify:CR=1 FL=1|nr:glycoside-pentoside-hexuronide (GPH):cation symporter [Clostridia bacterium]
MEEKKYLAKKEWVGFGLAATAGYMVAGISQMYLTIFFTDILLLTPTFILVLMLVARVWDAINDPIMGVIIDKTKTRYGKMRPYVFMGSILMAISTVVLFMPITEASEAGRMAFAAIAYLMFGMIYTLVDVPAMGLMSVATFNGKERSSLLSFYVTVGSIFGLLPMGLYLVLEMFIPKKWTYFVLACIVGVTALVGYLTLFFTAKERSATETQKIKVLDMWKIVKNNRPMVLTLLMSMIASPRYIILPALMYVATYVVKIGTLESGAVLLVLNLVIGAGMFLGILLTPPLYKKIGYRKASIVAAIVGGVGLSLAFIMSKIIPGNVAYYVAFPFMTIGGLGLGAYNVLPYPMVGDSLDYLEWRTGERMEGICFSLNSFVTKFNNAVGFVGVMVALIAFSFVKPVEPGVPLPQSQTTIDGIFATVTLIPGISFFLSIIPMILYNFTGKNKERILSELAVKRQEKAANKELEQTA